MTYRHPLFIAAMFLTACSDEPGDGATEANGSAMYRDAATDVDGNSQEPAAPSDDFYMEIRTEGTGTFDVSEPTCEADALSGNFDALYEGTAEVGDDGVYVASLTMAEAQTPSGCTIPSLEIGLVTDIVVRGELTATTQNCTTYCEAKARSYAESECSGSADEVTCRADAQVAYEGSCTSACEDDTHTIVAQTALGASSLSSLDFESLSGAALGTVSADLTFDHIEDGDGNEVDEEPGLF